MTPEELQEYRYRAVREVLDGSPIGEVAARYGTTRQSVHNWRARFLAEGMPGLLNRSRRPRSSPTRIAADVEAAVCRLRRSHPRWGARRIAFELGRAGVALVPSRATVHRVLVRNGLIVAQVQAHARRYKRWQRDAPMQLWQMDLVGGVFLADGRECKVVTGIDDNSRFVVIAEVVAVPTGRAVCEAFTTAMRRYGVPGEVLTDNGKQFTGRHMKPLPVEVMFERVCRENGISQRLTKPRSPTTTGKIERFHKTLRQEFLDASAPFASVQAAAEAIGGWVTSYNHARPHQALDMATPAERFRPRHPRQDLGDRSELVESGDGPTQTLPEQLPVIEAAPLAPMSAGAIEFEVRIPPSGGTTLGSTGQNLWMGPAWAGRTVTVWADQRSLHVSIDGHHLKTLRSRLSSDHLRRLVMRGARPAGPPPAPPALPHHGAPAIPTGEPIEVDRNVRRDGFVNVANQMFHIGRDHAGEHITLRLDGHLMHAISNGALAGTWPSPVPVTELGSIRGARAVSSSLPPPPLPAGSIRVQRRIGNDGRIMVGNQRMKLGRTYAGKIVTVIIEDTHFRVLHGEQELAVRPRRDTTPITKLKVYARHSNPTSNKS